MVIASIRVRFLLLIAIVIALLLGFAFYTNQSAETTIQKNKKISLQDQQLSETIGRIADKLRDLGLYVYQSAFLLEQFPARRLTDTIDRLNVDLAVLSSQASEYNTKEYSKVTESLRSTLMSLFEQVRTVIEVQKDVERLYPAVPIMLNKLQPMNQEFMAAAVVALEEAKISMDKPDQAKIYDQLRDLRYLWAQYVSSVRVFVANRLGAFGPARTSMVITENDRRLYGDAIEDILQRLTEADQRGRLEFVQSRSLKRMRELYREYGTEFLKAAEIYYSDKWRADYVVLREGINPLMEKAWQQISDLKNHVDDVTLTGINEYEDTTDILSRFIWMFVGLVTLLLVGGYVAFEYFIRRPILQVATALEAEGAGRPYNSKFRFQSLEIQRLTNAFSHMRDQVRSRQTRLQAILDNAGEGVLTVNEAGNIESLNKAGEILFGYSEKEVIGRPVATLIRRSSFDSHVDYDFNQIAKAQEFQFPFEEEVVGAHRSKTIFPVSIRWGKVFVDGTWLFIGLASDISERRAMLDRLTEMAEKDALTGLYNRHYFTSELERIVERSHRHDKANIALLYLDLDNFKYVNDTLGHLAGDEVLKEVTEILQQRARGSDLLARLGGDEFAILLYDIDTIQASGAAEAYRRILVDYVFHYEGKIVDIGCSIGVAMLEPSILKKEELLARADLACNIAKRAGRNRVHIYEVDDQEKANIMSADMGWARRIKKNIDTDQFVIVGQPIVRAKDHQLVGHEILIRMRDDSGELIMPSGFLPAAARFGLAVEVDRWVISNSMRLLSKQSPKKMVAFSINISAKSIADSSVLKLIQQEMIRWNIDPSQIVFEVTESGAIGNVGQAVKFLTRLNKMGCKTALDDFGVGYSSFSYLRDLPVDYVKFDGSFVLNLMNDKVKQAIITSMNDVAHALGKKTVAEFVESPQTLEFLTRIGVDFVQGYYVGMPRNLNEVLPMDNVFYISDYATPN